MKALQLKSTHNGIIRLYFKYAVSDDIYVNKQ